MREGDVVMRFNGVDVNDLNHLINMVSMAPIGRPAEMVVWRDRKKVSMKVTVGDKDPLAQASPPVSRPTSDRLLRRPDRPSSATSFALGLELATLDEAGTQRLGLPRAMRGAVVIEGLPRQPAGEAFPAARRDPDGQRPARSGAPTTSSRRSTRRAEGESMEVVVDRVDRGVIERLTFRIP